MWHLAVSKIFLLRGTDEVWQEVDNTERRRGEVVTRSGGTDRREQD